MTFARTAAAVASLLTLLPAAVQAKTSVGSVQLGPHRANEIFDSFAVPPGTYGRIELFLTTDESDQDSRALKFRILKDDQYLEYMNAPSCSTKIQHTTHTEHVDFDDFYSYEFDMILDATSYKRPHYFYFAIDDCSLEKLDADQLPDVLPAIQFRIEAKNDQSHLSADEFHLRSLHTTTLLVSGAVVLALFLFCLHEARHNYVHAAMLWVLVAASLDFASSALELVDLVKYSQTGFRSPVFETLSAYSESACDSLVALLLLSVASGWCMPADMLAVNHISAIGKAATQMDSWFSIVRVMTAGFQSPIRALEHFTPSAIFAVCVFEAHLFLAQLGFWYNSSFDSYHDLDHLPGHLLMAIRVVLGAMLIFISYKTWNRCTSPSMQRFYLGLAIVGTMWFYSMPAVVWWCNSYCPYYLQHWTVSTWSAALQSCSLLSLTWLVMTQNITLRKHYVDLPLGGLDGSGYSSTSPTKAKSFLGMLPTSKIRVD